MAADRDRTAAASERPAELARRRRDSPPMRDLAVRFAGLGDDDVGEIAHRAHDLLEDDEWVGALLAPGIAALADDPWAQPPLAVSRDPAKTGAVLFDAGTIVVTASITAAAALAARPAASVIVPGRLAIVRYVRSGDARLHLWRAPRVGPEFSAADAAPASPLGALPLGDGVVLRLDGRTRGWWLSDAAGDVVTITATLRAGQAPLMREYAIPSGAFLRCATLDERAARAQMLLTFLRVAGRREEGEQFAAATRDPAAFLRWSAMREWLALDALTALPRLAEMAEDDPSDEIRDVARDTLALVEAKRCPS